MSRGLPGSGEIFLSVGLCAASGDRYPRYRKQSEQEVPHALLRKQDVESKEPFPRLESASGLLEVRRIPTGKILTRVRQSTLSCRGRHRFDKSSFTDRGQALAFVLVESGCWFPSVGNLDSTDVSCCCSTLLQHTRVGQGWAGR